MGFAIGMLRLIPAASAPSARIHCDFGSTPLLPESGEAHARPFGTGNQAVERLHAERGRGPSDREPTITPHIDKGDTRFHRIAGEGFEREDERAFDETMDQ